MNLNYNINNTLLGRNRNFLLGKVAYLWQRGVSVAAGLQSGSIIFGTGSITYTPYAPTTLFVSGTYDAQLLGSGSALGIPIALSVTGSGIWPTTGSNVLYINVGGNLGFNQNTSSIFSAAAGNMNLSSGSRISSSFTPLGNQEYNIDLGITHIKGNIYNPIVNVLSINNSPSAPQNVNGYSASLNVVKDVNVSLFDIKNITGSKVTTFNYDYNFGVTSSLTASIQSNATGSTTMSISIPEAGVFTSSLFFNPTSAGTKIITGSFAANADSTYNVTASVTYNKGNTSNSDINWKVSSSSTTQDLEGNQSNINGVSSSFQLKKDIAVMVNYTAITSSISGSYPNDYSFNQTASIISNVNNTTGSVTMSLIIPEAGISTSSLFFNPNTTVAYISASFAAFGQAPFNITASIINNKGNQANSNVNWRVSGSNNNLSSSISSSFTIVKNANESKVNVSNILIPTSSTYKNEYAFNQTASLSASFNTGWLNCFSSSAYGVRVDLIVPEIGANLTTYSSSAVLTASFVATTASSSYNITASANAFSSSVLPATIYVCGGEPNFGRGFGSITSASIGLVQNFVYDVIDYNIENPAPAQITSFKINSFSLSNPLNYQNLIISASSSYNIFGQDTTIPAYTFTDYFPFPSQTSAPLQWSEVSRGLIAIAYFGTPTLNLSGPGNSTEYYSGSNMTVHKLVSANATAVYTPIPTQSFSNHLEAEILTVGAGGRSGIAADYWSKQTEFGQPAAAAGAGGAGGYVYAKNYLNKSKNFIVNVAPTTPAWINDLPSAPTEGIEPLSTSGSNSYITDDSGSLIQFARGGGHGGTQTYYNTLPPSTNINRNGRNGGSGGGGGFFRSTPTSGGSSLSGSVTLPSSSYNAWEGFSGGGFQGPNSTFGSTGGGGGASSNGQFGVTGFGPTGNGGLGKLSLDFIPVKLAGGGIGINATITSSAEFGGGLPGITGSATNGASNTGGGGGAVKYDSSNEFFSTTGGSGLVQIRYKGLPQATGGVVTTGSLCDGIYTLHTFTSSGTFTWN